MTRLTEAMSPRLWGEGERRHQLERLRDLLNKVLPSNQFYGAKLKAAGVTAADDLQTWRDYEALPFTTKSELSQDQEHHPPYGKNLTYPRGEYIRVHQTSGTTGRRLRWLDTADSWTWWGECWQAVYRGAGVTSVDRIFFAFSFGPFIGFWSAYEGASQLGAMAIAGGGMSSRQRSASSPLGQRRDAATPIRRCGSRSRSRDGVGAGPGRGYRCGSLRRSMASASQRAQSASMAAVRNPNSSAARAKKAVSESPHSTESRMCS